MHAFLFVYFKPSVSSPKYLLDEWWSRPTLSAINKLIIKPPFLVNIFWKVLSIKANIPHTWNKLTRFVHLKLWQILIFMHTLNKLQVNIFTFCIIIQYFDANSDRLTWIHQSVSITYSNVCYFGWFIESRFLTNCTIITYYVKS